MSVIVPSYTYTYIKIDFLKQLIIDNETLKKLRLIDDIREFINFIRPYYPGIKIYKFEIEEIEKELYHTFFKLIGKIISFSPFNMRLFLKNYLLKYEIINIKKIILGLIIGLSKKERAERINFFIEELIGNVQFINRLLDCTSLDEVQVVIKNTKYYKAIREGIIYFINYNDTFVLEAFLDQLYYLAIEKEEQSYTKAEKQILTMYVNSLIEIYNLNVIYRGILNNIDKKLLSQFLVKKFLFLDDFSTEKLLNQNNIDDFISTLDNVFKRNKNVKKFYALGGINKEHVYWSIEAIYISNFFSLLKYKIDDIEYSTIFKIIEIIINKQKEIQFDVLPNVVKIIHKKFQILEEGVK